MTKEIKKIIKKSVKEIGGSANPSQVEALQYRLQCFGASKGDAIYLSIKIVYHLHFDPINPVHRIINRRGEGKKPRNNHAYRSYIEDMRDHRAGFIPA